MMELAGATICRIVIMRIGKYDPAMKTILYNPAGLNFLLIFSKIGNSKSLNLQNIFYKNKYRKQ